MLVLNRLHDLILSENYEAKHDLYILEVQGLCIKMLVHISQTLYNRNHSVTIPEHFEFSVHSKP